MGAERKETQIYSPTTEIYLVRVLRTVNYPLRSHPTYPAVKNILFLSPHKFLKPR